MERLKAIAIEAAWAAGAVAQSGFGQPKQVRTKSSASDLVTEFDRKAQEAAFAVVRASCPDHDLLGEEGDSQHSGSPWLWAIDPIDGTTNFAHDNPYFCSSVAVLRDSQPQAGAIYAPCLGELFVAARGQGATLNGRAIHASATGALAQALLCTGFSYREQVKRDNLVFFARAALQSQAMRRTGAAALDLCWVAMGRLDAYWELDLNLWDFAAGQLVVTEAGGRVSDLLGVAPSPDTRQVLASNGKIHGEMLALFKG